MNGIPVRPRWRVLDLILIVVIALLVVEARAHLSSLGHEFAEVAIVLVWVVLMYLWLQANAAAISQEQWRKTGKTVRIAPGCITVYRKSSLPASQKAEPAQPLSSAPGHHQVSTAQQDERGRYAGSCVSSTGNRGPDQLTRCERNRAAWAV